MKQVTEVLTKLGKWIGDFFKRVIASPKSSAVGIVAIANGVKVILANPVGFLTNEEFIISFLVGIGLLFAADQQTKKE
jgi:hypothetical protein